MKATDNQTVIVQINSSAAIASQLSEMHPGTIHLTHFRRQSLHLKLTAPDAVYSDAMQECISRHIQLRAIEGAIACSLISKRYSG